MSLAGRFPNCEWIVNARNAGSDYAGPDYYPYKPVILLHMTVGMGLSKSYVSGHNVPPHQWFNVYTGDNWQTVEADRAALALYQPQYGYHWTNKHAYLLQTELVGIPVVSQATYTLAQCESIAENVVVPQVQWLRSRGLDVDLNQVKYHSNTSGSASVNWHGRMSEQEMADYNGLMAHIDAWGNDHWDCSAEWLHIIASHSLTLLRGHKPAQTPIEEDEDMLIQYLSDPKQGGDGTLYFSNGLNTWPIRSDETRVMYESLGQVRRVTNKDGESFTQVGDLKIPFKLQPYWLNRLNPTRVFFEDRPKAV